MFDGSLNPKIATILVLGIFGIDIGDNNYDSDYVNNNSVAEKSTCSFLDVSHICICANRNALWARYVRRPSVFPHIRSIQISSEPNGTKFGRLIL